MTPRTRISVVAIALAVVAVVLVVVAVVQRGSHGPPTAARSPRALPITRAGVVTLTGTVRDADTHPVAGVEVMFRRAGRDTIATTGADGSYRIELPAGTYRVATRADRMLSVALADRPRLPELPSSTVAGIPDEALMLRLDATTDLDGVDLDVVATWRIAGRVLDPDGLPVAGAVVRADPEDARVAPANLRPVLGTDSAVSDSNGRFELRVAPGAYTFAANHPSYAGIRDTDQETVGGAIEHTIFLAVGCTITGRIVDARGEPAPDGAIERQTGFSQRDFEPSGRIQPDGTFRWATTRAEQVTLRAWPWHSPPTAEQTFECSDGKRFEGVVFKLPATPPDLEGILVDNAAEPVPFAYLDVSPLDLGGVGQQERTDAAGRWQVHRLPSGRYNLRAHAPGRGAVDAVVRSPDRRVELRLGGVGRLVGTTTLLERGSFRVTRMICKERSARAVSRSIDRRLIVIRGGRFEIDDLPACDLEAILSWRDQHVELSVTIPAGGTATVEVPLGKVR